MRYPRPTSADPSVVTTRADFASFLEEVVADYMATGQDEWQNVTLEQFLDALSAFADARLVGVDWDQESPSWRLFANMIVAATVYE